MIRRFLFTALLGLVTLSTATAQITPPNTFVPNTVAQASQVNDNFTTLGNQALNRAGGGAITGNVAVSNGITIDGVDVGTLCSGCAPVLVGTNFTGIPETAILDGSLLARVAGNETIVGNWIFNTIISLTATVPGFILTESDASANNKIWRIFLDGAQFNIDAINDALTVSAPVLRATRSGASITTNQLRTNSLWQFVDNNTETVRAQLNSAGQWAMTAGIAGAPTLSMLTDLDTGVYWIGGDSIAIATGGVEALRIDINKAVLHQLGSASLPTISFAGDTDTGLYSNGTNTVSITTAGVERTRTDANGTLIHSFAERDTAFLTPAALTAGNNNNFAPAGLGQTRTLRVTPDGGGTSTLTGIAAESSGFNLTVCNAGPTLFTIANENANSTAANRIIYESAWSGVVRVSACADLRYDPIATRWQVLSHPAS